MLASHLLVTAGVGIQYIVHGVYLNVSVWLLLAQTRLVLSSSPPFFSAFQAAPTHCTLADDLGVLRSASLLLPRTRRSSWSAPSAPGGLLLQRLAAGIVSSAHQGELRKVRGEAEAMGGGSCGRWPGDEPCIVLR